MRPVFFYTFFFTLIFTMGYVLYGAYTTCQVPISYTGGEIDDSFGLSKDVALEAIADAEAVWEAVAGKELFTYDPTDGAMVVNFIYDERQAYADAEAETRAELNAAQSINESLNTQYEKLVTTYNALQQTYEAKVSAYQSQLKTYNETVARYNRAGGAPQAEYERLQAEGEALEDTRIELETEEKKLQSLVDQINTISERGNQVVERYNEEVETYNDTFGEAREFTQGTYTSNGTIDIYSFEDQYELRLVLAHELGHALGIDHVSGTESVMYFLIGGQLNPVALTANDTAALAAICGEGSLWNNIREKTKNLFGWL